ncbi:MAG: arylesterase, partial [Bacteroidetes bacterium]
TASTDPWAGETRPALLFFGNSLTAGYGLDNPQDAFPGLIARRVDSLGLPYRVVQAGVSGETTADGLNRVGWLLRQPVAVFVLELGANDGLRGLPPAETRANLAAIIDTVRARQPEAAILLAGMMVPPSMGPDYGAEFAAIYPGLAEEKDVALVPFLLEGVGGEADLNQGDGIHPTAEGHIILADNIWAVLAPMLRPVP